MDFQFQRHRVDRITRDKIAFELEIVAKKFNYREFTCREFNTGASIKHQTVLREFGNWSKAMEFLRDHLSKKDIKLQPRQKPKRKDYIPDREIFDEMERIWKKLGHRPSKIEWDSANSRFNYNTVRRHFDGWTNACLKFIEYKMGKAVLVDDVKEDSDKISTIKIKDQEERREIPLKLRLKVLQRDSFRCILCGKSPAIDPGTVLHIDHVIPFSKGGKTILNNLRTLCAECNWGKGAD
ncbi:HNH endonuclease [Patescibacteria group bacterium]|nr:HNH endonuclease [Patescibacteria group bacterium]